MSSGLGLSNVKAEGDVRLETMTSLFLACEGDPDPDPPLPLRLSDLIRWEGSQGSGSSSRTRTEAKAEGKALECDTLSKMGEREVAESSLSSWGILIMGFSPFFLTFIASFDLLCTCVAAALGRGVTSSFGMKAGRFGSVRVKRLW